MSESELAALREEMSTLRARVAAQEARFVMPEAMGVSRAARPRRRRMAVLAGGLLVLLLVLSPLGTLAANFQDLNPNSPHNTNINLIADAGISKGCGDTAHYCPNAYVSREEMASFLARTAGLGNNPPIANAATAQTATNAVTAQTAANATNAVNAENAAKLGGVPASGYLRTVGKMVYEISPLSLVDLNNQIGVDVAIVPASTGIVSVSSSVVGTRSVVLPLPVPRSIFGTSLSISAVTICYSAESGAKIDMSGVYESKSNGGYVQDLHDDTDRASAAYACYTVNAPTLYAIAGNPYLSLSLKFTNTSAKLYLAEISIDLTAVP
ncbi:MAG: hypothetical protein U0841_21210 [Chloroflexia bacterium]